MKGVSKFRGKLYRFARLLGDLQALGSGRPDKMFKRGGRRIAGKWTSKKMKQFFK